MNRMTEKPPICPKCEIRPRNKIKNPKNKGGRIYNSYCPECDIEKHRQYQRNKKRLTSEISPLLLCSACEKNKAKKGQKYCDSCYAQATQAIIWGRIAEKIEDLVKYITKEAEFPPRIEKQAESRIKDAMSNLNFTINLMEEENGINKKNR